MFDIDIKLISSKDNKIIDKKSYTAIDYDHMQGLVSAIIGFEINMLLSNYPIPSIDILTSVSINDKEILLGETEKLNTQEERLANVILKNIENITYMIACVRNALKNNAKEKQIESKPEIEVVIDEPLAKEESLNRLRSLLSVEAEWSEEEYTFYAHCYANAKDSTHSDQKDLIKIIEGFVDII